MLTFGWGIFLGVGIGMNIGVWLAVYVSKKAYGPYIKELKEYATYWYEQHRKC